MGRLDRKVALVTGAAHGIGEGIGRAFVEEGATVIFSDIEDERGNQVAESVGEQGRYWHLDVREEVEWERVVGAILREYGRLDVLVNNAGITGFEGVAVA